MPHSSVSRMSLIVRSAVVDFGFGFDFGFGIGIGLDWFVFGVGVGFGFSFSFGFDLGFCSWIKFSSKDLRSCEERIHSITESRGD
jgi:hypothetical protein